MGIPVGKLAVYVSAAGVHPAVTLPISLDVGTDNRDLLDDPPRGLPRRACAARPTDSSSSSSSTRWPAPSARRHPVGGLQGLNAHRLLARYRHRVPSFNDDIQGTGATALAGVQAASGIPACLSPASAF